LLREDKSAPGGTMSRRKLGIPALARCAAIREPIVPAPRIATLWIRFMVMIAAIQ